MRRFYAPPENFNSPALSLNLEESLHLREVLRLRSGDEISVFDGQGKEFLCEVLETGTKKTVSTLKILREISSASPESDLNLTLAVSLLKGEKFDLVVQKAVELGATEIVPLLTKRCDVKLNETKTFDKKRERLQRIALEAAKQSGRAKLTNIAELTDFNIFIKKADGAKILFAERDGTAFQEIKAAERITAVIGSEGGWEDSEIEAARTNDFQIITLGGRILRAETAAISITAILQHRFGDLF